METIINTMDVREMLMEDIFSKFEEASIELENEKEVAYYLTVDEFKDIELDSKWFNRLVDDGLIELN